MTNASACMNISNRKFDQDNDDTGSGCAVAFKGAWWYVGCHDSNLNGLYLNGAH